MTYDVTCPVCGRAFRPTPNQHRLYQRDEPVYCSRACARQAQEEETTMVCSVCGYRATRYAASQSFYDYFDFDFRRFCSLECLFEALMAGLPLTLPPSSAKQLVPLELMSDIEGRTSKGIRNSPQMYLFNMLSLMYPNLEWSVEYSIGTGTYQNDRPKRYRLDIAEPYLYIAIECDGGSHLSKKAMADDVIRDMVLAGLGWTTVRLTYDEIKNDISGCLGKIQRIIHRNAPLLTTEINGEIVYQPGDRKKKR